MVSGWLETVFPYLVLQQRYIGQRKNYPLPHGHGKKLKPWSSQAAMDSNYDLYSPKIRGKWGTKPEISAFPATCLPPLFRPESSLVAVTVVYLLAIFLQAERRLRHSWTFGSSTPSSISRSVLRYADAYYWYRVISLLWFCNTWPVIFFSLHSLR